MLIPFQEISDLCDKEITGIIHVGAHTAEESKYYDKPTIWIEANKELYDKLPFRRKHHFAATDYNGTATLNLCQFKAASSLLEPNLNKRRTDIKVVDRVEVPARRIETIQKKGYNFINLDIQGVELKALRGCNLSLIDYIYTEVHEVETYKGCSKIWELDNYLKDFKRVKTKMTPEGWGDAFYIKI